MAPDGWCSADLDSLARVNPEQVGNRTDPEHLLEYLDIAAIEQPGVIGATRTLRFSEAPSRARRLARNGDILVSTVRPYLRNFARIREAPDNLVVSTGYAVIRPGSVVDGRFLYQHILSAGFIDFLKPRMSGSNYPAVTASDVEAYPLSLPPLPEQHKIAAILSSVDDAIEKTRAVIDQVQIVKRGLMQDLLTRGLPGRHTRFKQTEIGRVPTDWGIKSVGDVFEVLDRMRKPLNKSQRETMKGPYPYCGANGVFDYVSEWLFDEPLILMAEDGGYFDEFKTRPIAYMMDGKCWVNNHAHVLRAREGFDIRWLFYSLVHMDVRPFINTGTRSKLNQRELINIPVAAPPVPEQREIAAILSSVDDAMEESQTFMDRLRVVKSGLMSILLTGELRVTPDPETV